MILLKDKRIEPGKAIKELRVDAGFSQQELADRAELSRVTVTNIENLKKDMRVDTFIRLLGEMGYALEIK